MTMWDAMVQFWESITDGFSRIGDGLYYLVDEFFTYSNSLAATGSTEDKVKLVAIWLGLGTVFLALVLQCSENPEVGLNPEKKTSGKKTTKRRKRRKKTAR